MFGKAYKYSSREWKEYYYFVQLNNEYIFPRNHCMQAAGKVSANIRH